jgi:O-6-methylguanine DNA methyltransferase
LAGDKGLIATSLGESWRTFNSRHEKTAPGGWQEVRPEKDRTLAQAVRALRSYLSDGTPLPHDIPLDPRGTAFRRRAWAALRRIPHGKTATYGDIARRVGSPKAFRAVGGACASNPLPLFIPCHRVLAGDGGLGGFGGGLKLKRRLLDLEIG